MNLFRGGRSYCLTKVLSILSYLTKVSILGTWKSLPLVGSSRYFCSVPSDFLFQKHISASVTGRAVPQHSVNE